MWNRSTVKRYYLNLTSSSSTPHFSPLHSALLAISQISIMATVTHTHSHQKTTSYKESGSFDILSPLRRWLDQIQITSATLAHLICQLIPCTCPFERTITFFGRTLLNIPPLCKLNPFYDQFVGLRFRALTFLSDECGEDVTKYCC